MRCRTCDVHTVSTPEVPARCPLLYHIIRMAVQQLCMPVTIGPTSTRQPQSTILDPLGWCGRAPEEAQRIFPHEFMHGLLTQHLAPGNDGVRMIGEDRLRMRII